MQVINWIFFFFFFFLGDGAAAASADSGARAGENDHDDAVAVTDASASSGTYLLFPGEGSVPLESLPLGTVKRLIVIDSTWLQTKAMLRDNRLKSLPRVSIVAEKTKFWRFQTGILFIYYYYYFIYFTMQFSSN